jgi:hypothetical protein
MRKLPTILAATAMIATALSLPPALGADASTHFRAAVRPPAASRQAAIPDLLAKVASLAHAPAPGSRRAALKSCPGPAPGDPPATCASGAPAPAACTYIGTVVFAFYQTFSPPTPGSCWSMYRPTGADSGTFRYCKYQGSPDSTGSFWIYDDTNPSHTSPTDASYMKNTCGTSSLWAEYMAAAGGNWKVVGSGSGISVTRYYKELYCCDASRDQWGPGYVSGVAPVPVVNVQPDLNSQSQLNADIGGACHWYTDPPPGTVYWISLYANTTVSPTQISMIDSALNSCYH